MDYSGTLLKEHLRVKDTANQDTSTSPNFVYFPPKHTSLCGNILVPRVSIVERFHWSMLKREVASLITIAACCAYLSKSHQRPHNVDSCAGQWDGVYSQ